MAGLLGQRDELLRLIEEAFPDDQIVVQGNEISVEGPDAESWCGSSTSSSSCSQSGQDLDASTLARTIDMVRDDVRPERGAPLRGAPRRRRRRSGRRRPGQKRYADAIAQNIVTFGIGPAGTGKSYLAVALAVQALQSRQVDRIILTRPAVEAGERLGFLPGRPHGQGRPLPAPALRRALRPARARGRPAAARPGHHRGGPARLHARPHAQQLLHHPRRGPEHDARADEDVPDPHRLRLQGASSPATSPRSTCPGGRSGLVGLEPVLGRHRRPRVRPPRPSGTWSATGSWPTSWTPTSGQKGGRVTPQ